MLPLIHEAVLPASDVINGSFADRLKPQTVIFYDLKLSFPHIRESIAI